MSLGFLCVEHQDNEVSISNLVLETYLNLASVCGEEILQNISQRCSIPLHCKV